MNDYPQLRKGLLLALVAAVMWAILGIALKVVSTELDDVTIVWMRFFTAFLFTCAIFATHRRSGFQVFVRPQRLFLFAGLGLMLNYLFYMHGISLTTPSNGQIFIQVGPVLVTIAGIIMFKERLSVGQIGGVMLSVFGFALFFQDQFNAAIGMSSDYTVGTFSTIFAACAWATYTVLTKRALHQGLQVQELNFFIYGLASVTFFPFAHLDKLAAVPWQHWPLLLFLGLNTLISYAAYAEAFKYAPASLISVIIITNPVLTMVLMSLFAYLQVSWINGEKLSSQAWLGAFCVVMGAWLVVSLIRKTEARTSVSTSA